MRTFANSREAKESLVAQIVSQAQRDGVTLSDLEQKMLYFSETAWAPPGMLEIAGEFERHYDQTAFEAKIAGVIRSLKSSQSAAENRNWERAVDSLRAEDHYLLVMIDSAQLRPRHDFLKLILFVLAIVAILLVAALYVTRRL